MRFPTNQQRNNQYAYPGSMRQNNYEKNIFRGQRMQNFPNTKRSKWDVVVDCGTLVKEKILAIRINFIHIS